MVKKILLGMLLLLVGTGGYFYFFPIYPDFNISESEFYTLHHGKNFESTENGFFSFSGALDIISNNQIINTFSDYEKCNSKQICLPLYKYIDTIESQIQTGKTSSTFTVSPRQEQLEEFKKVKDQILKQLKNLNEYPYITFHNYTPLSDGHPQVGSQIIYYVGLLNFNRALVFYFSNDKNITKKEIIKDISSLYSSLSLLTRNTDAVIIDYLIFITSINMVFDYIEKNVDNFSKDEKRILGKILQMNEINSEMIKNGLKGNYFYSKNIAEHIHLKALKNNFLNILFYDHEDTINLMKKIEYMKINNEYKDNFIIKKNISNWLGRYLLSSMESDENTYLSQFSKEKKLLERRENLIRLLSQ